MRALVIEHDPYSTVGSLGPLLEERGIQLDSLVVAKDIDHPASDVTFPKPSDYDMVIAMGSPWSVYEDAISSWMGSELEFLRSAVKDNVPVLGICFGGQALSAALGGVVSPSPVPEYGWGPIDVEEGVDAIAAGPWFQYHKDEFTLPQGAEPLARNDSGLQAFKIGRSLGIQWHPEIEGPLLQSWYDVGGREPLLEAGLEPDALLEETAMRSSGDQIRVKQLLDYFLDDVAGLASES